jgi:hypothetical protein
MIGLAATVNAMIQRKTFDKVLLNRTSQFGRPGRTYLGARFLPERLVPNNSYIEGEIRYRSVVALDASRYSPAQKRGNEIVGTMRVDLTDQDIAEDYTSEDYDAQIAIDKLNSDAENLGNPNFGEEGLRGWFNLKINVPLIEKIEKMRWEALVDAVVPLRGNNGYAEDVALPNPTGQRVAASDDWTDPTFNPIEDIIAMVQAAEEDDYQIGAFVAGSPVIWALLRNPKVITAAKGYINVNAGALVDNSGMLTREGLNAYLDGLGMPAIIPYNLKYRDQLTSHFFLKRDVFVGLSLTGRQNTLDLGDGEFLPMRDTLGYAAIGRAAGQGAPGRASFQAFHGDKPPRLEVQGWMTSFPVLSDPQAVRVIHTINTTPE